MQTLFLSFHSIVRWLILLFIIIVLVKSASGMSGKKPFTASDKRSALFLLICCDIQFLLGLYLYIVNGWWGKWSEGANMMHNTFQRFYTMEHNVAMIVAIIFVHIGYSNAKSDKPDQIKFKRLFWFVLIALIIILASIPWPFRADIGRPWFRMP